MEGVLDITPAYLPDDYLVLTGSRSAPGSSRGGHRPWLITHAFLFDAVALVAALEGRGSKIGIASSVPRQYWDSAEIYPTPRNPHLVLSDLQRTQLALFA